MRRPAGLPEGAVVRLNRHTRALEGGRVLVGGAPTRVAQLKPAARRLLRDGRVTVRDAASRALAEHLLETGLADPVAGSLPPVDPALVSVVIPVWGRARQLDRLLASIRADLGGVHVIAVDDRSPVEADEVATVAASHGAELVVLPENLGPAGARDAGLRRVRTPYVLFVDTDAVLRPGAVALLLRHFADAGLAAVAPRVAGLPQATENWVLRYEAARSSLDLGGDAALVQPRSPMAWVSSTCLLARVEAIGEGFDAAMRAGEDVDLVWRLVDAGWRVRFDPAAVVDHEHRAAPDRWLARKFFYGQGAAPLAARHPDHIPPAILAPWTAVVLAALIAQRRWSLPLAGGISVVAAVRIARKLRGVRRPYRLAAELAANGLMSAIAQGFALLLRHWWPLTVIGCLVSARVRRATLLAAVADTAWEYARTRPELDPVRFGVARRLDDLAYGAGVWWGAWKARSVRALLPSITRGRPRTR